MLTGAVGTVTDADGGTVRPGSLDKIVADDATGEVYATSGPGSLLCFGGGTSLAEVNPATGTVKETTGGTFCDTDLAVDSAAGNLLSVNYRSVSVSIPGTSSLVVIPEAKPSNDSVHHLALVLYSTPPLPSVSWLVRSRPGMLRTCLSAQQRQPRTSSISQPASSSRCSSTSTAASSTAAWTG